MSNLDEQYDNLYDFIKNIENLIQKNIFNGQHIEEVSHFGHEVMELCKSKSFNISSNDLKALKSFNELFLRTPDASKTYLVSQVEIFYTNIIEPTKDELY